VLLFSGYPGPDAHAHGAAGVEYLTKPVTPKQLLQRIDQLLGST
jgi:CheY-like chemotaxis protein